MKHHFATLATNRYWVTESILLAKSLRAFSGDFADSPLTIFTPDKQPFSPGIQSEFDQLSIQFAEFTLLEEAAKFPLGIIPYCAAAAESMLEDQCDVLVWLLPDTLIISPPSYFALLEEKILAYRPVHHQNIGSSFNQPLDEFWQRIYKHTNTPEDKLFKMITCYREEVRPYFNAGVLAVRPGQAILRKWANAFERTYQHPDFIPLYKDQRYAIFMHQAVLAGVILHQLSTDQLFELPENYNYPLHMHADYPRETKISRLSELITARYENTKELLDFLAPFEDKSKILALM